ncbi:hypothetical protein [Streptomyces sp. Agncl-13]|uniref:hypothetical protein n=1 Tax=Streptomyces sp. Agncl-13 TaxID=3400628 RepID=UPI003A858F37
MENALRELGIEPHVVANADDAAGLAPLHTLTCLVVHVHGDYLRPTTMLNTPEELDHYAPAVDTCSTRSSLSTDWSSLAGRPRGTPPCATPLPATTPASSPRTGPTRRNCPRPPGTCSPTARPPPSGPTPTHSSPRPPMPPTPLQTLPASTRSASTWRSPRPSETCPAPSSPSLCTTPCTARLTASPRSRCAPTAPGRSPTHLLSTAADSPTSKRRPNSFLLSWRLPPTGETPGLICGGCATSSSSASTLTRAGTRPCSSLPRPLPPWSSTRQALPLSPRNAGAPSFASSTNQPSSTGTTTRPTLRRRFSVPSKRSALARHPSVYTLSCIPSSPATSPSTRVPTLTPGNASSTCACSSSTTQTWDSAGLTPEQGPEATSTCPRQSGWDSRLTGTATTSPCSTRASSTATHDGFRQRGKPLSTRTPKLPPTCVAGRPCLRRSALRLESHPECALGIVRPRCQP